MFSSKPGAWPFCVPLLAIAIVVLFPSHTLLYPVNVHDYHAFTTAYYTFNTKLVEIKHHPYAILADEDPAVAMLKSVQKNLDEIYPPLKALEHVIAVTSKFYDAEMWAERCTKLVLKIQNSPTTIDGMVDTFRIKSFVEEFSPENCNKVTGKRIIDHPYMSTFDAMVHKLCQNIGQSEVIRKINMEFYVFYKWRDCRIHGWHLDVISAEVYKNMRPSAHVRKWIHLQEHKILAQTPIELTKRVKTLREKTSKTCEQVEKGLESPKTPKELGRFEDYLTLKNQVGFRLINKIFDKLSYGTDKEEMALLEASLQFLKKTSEENAAFFKKLSTELADNIDKNMLEAQFDKYTTLHELAFLLSASKLLIHRLEAQVLQIFGVYTKNVHHPVNGLESDGKTLALVNLVEPLHKKLEYMYNVHDRRGDMFITQDPDDEQRFTIIDAADFALYTYKWLKEQKYIVEQPIDQKSTEEVQREINNHMEMQKAIYLGELVFNGYTSHRELMNRNEAIAAEGDDEINSKSPPTDQKSTSQREQKVVNVKEDEKQMKAESSILGPSDVTA